MYAMFYSSANHTPDDLAIWIEAIPALAIQGHPIAMNPAIAFQI